MLIIQGFLVSIVVLHFATYIYNNLVYYTMSLDLSIQNVCTFLSIWGK